MAAKQIDQFSRRYCHVLLLALSVSWLVSDLTMRVGSPQAVLLPPTQLVFGVFTRVSGP